MQFFAGDYGLEIHSTFNTAGEIVINMVVVIELIIFLKILMEALCGVEYL